MRNLPAVLLPADRPASLGIARSLGRRGISVYGIDPDPNAIGMVSRYIKPCPLPNQDDSDATRLQFLLDLGRKLGEKAVLYPVRDDDVLLCSRERDELKKYYLYSMPDRDVIQKLVTKDGLHEAAEQFQIPAPQMFRISSLSQLKDTAGHLPFPVILKPVLSSSWLQPGIISLLRENSFSGAPKVCLCRNAEELLSRYREISVYDSHVIIEEVIPGEDERLAYFCFYLDSESRPLAVFAGRKIRVLPVGFGSATYVRSFRDPQLEDIAMRLLSLCKYRGPGGVEFKRDPRDGTYKLIEFNARFGMWDTLSVRCGIDMPYIAYQDAQGIPVQPQSIYREGVLWVDLQRDVRAFIMYRRHKQLSFAQWLKSLWGEKDWAVFSRNDMKPAFLATLRLLETPFSKTRRELGTTDKASASPETLPSSKDDLKPMTKSSKA